MREILNASETARVIGCAPQMVRERIKRGIWTFGSVVTAKQSGNMQNAYEINKRDLAAWLKISVEEVEKKGGIITPGYAKLRNLSTKFWA